MFEPNFNLDSNVFFQTVETRIHGMFSACLCVQELNIMASNYNYYNGYSCNESEYCKYLQGNKSFTHFHN